MTKYDDWAERMGCSARTLAYIAILVMAVAIFASCNTNKKVIVSSDAESITNRVWYDHTMSNLGIVKGKSTVKDISAVAVIGRKVVVYDTSLAVRDSATGEWSAPVLYTIEEKGTTESETHEKSDEFENDTLSTSKETIIVTDSVGREHTEMKIEKKRTFIGWQSRLWVVICLCLVIAIILLWKFAKTLK